MRRWVKVALRVLTVAAVVMVLGVAALIGIFWHFAGSMCGNEILSSTEIDGTDLRVVIFERNCGATTGFSTQASVISKDGQLPNEAGNIFTSDTNHGAAPSGPGGGPELRVRVTGLRAIELSYHSATRVFMAEATFKEVHITYSVFPDR